MGPVVLSDKSSSAEGPLSNSASLCLMQWPNLVQMAANSSEVHAAPRLHSCLRIIANVHSPLPSCTICKSPIIVRFCRPPQTCSHGVSSWTASAIAVTASSETCSFERCHTCAFVASLRYWHMMNFQPGALLRWWSSRLARAKSIHSRMDATKAALSITCQRLHF